MFSVFLQEKSKIAFDHHIIAIKTTSYHLKQAVESGDIGDLAYSDIWYIKKTLEPEKQIHSLILYGYRGG